MDMSKNSRNCSNTSVSTAKKSARACAFSTGTRSISSSSAGLGVLVHRDQLASSGIQLAPEDFGTGDSSLGYRNRLPLRTLKVDKAFISGTAAELERLFSGEDRFEGLYCLLQPAPSLP